MVQTEGQFTKILESMTEAKEQNDSMEKEVLAIAEVLNELGIAFEEVTNSAEKLANVAQHLN